MHFVSLIYIIMCVDSNVPPLKQYSLFHLFLTSCSTTLTPVAESFLYAPSRVSAVPWEGISSNACGKFDGERK